MDNSVEIALIAAFGAFCTVTAPLIMVILQNRGKRADAEQARIDRAADWARQDIVAARVEAATRAAAEAAKTAAISQKSTEKKLDELHALGNSGLSAQMQATLTASKAQLAAMEVNANGNREGQRAITDLQNSITDQEVILAERQRAALVAEEAKKT